MIEYVARSGPPEAMNCPAFICDVCRKQVVGSGNVVWGSTIGSDGPHRQTPTYVTHKHPCTRAFDLWFARTYPKEDGWVQLWEEADQFIKQLAFNLTHAFADDPEGEYHEHRLVMPVKGST